MSLDMITVYATAYMLISLIVGIFVHELGHLSAARFFGIEVTVLKVGFGPELFGITDKNGVRWAFAPILFGGSCGFTAQRSAVQVRGAKKAPPTLLDEAPVAQRAIVCIAGPLANVAFAGLVWVAVIYHKTILPFMSDIEVMFGVPTFLVVVSLAFAAFNLLPLPPLDGGQLFLLGLEAWQGKPVSNEERLVRIGSWITAALTVVMLFFSIPRLLLGAP